MKIFLNVILNVYNSSCKIGENNISTEKQAAPWMTRSLLKCIQEKHRLCRLSVDSAVFKNQFLNDKNYHKKCIYIWLKNNTIALS